MRRWKIFLMGLLVMLLTTSCDGCTPPSSEYLLVPLYPQETNKWCWAASGQMIMDYLGTNVTQCVQVNTSLNRTDCCNTPMPTDCIHGGWPEFDKYGFSFQRTNRMPLSWSKIRDEVGCHGRPFAFSYDWINGGGHTMVAVGYQVQDGINMVEVNDPWPPFEGKTGDASIVSYDEFVSGADHTHWDDFYEIISTGGN